MRSIPVTILGGSDRKPGALPESGAGLHPLATYKGAAMQVAGRPLVAILSERLRAAGGFGPISIAGPARVYAPLGLDARIVEADGSVATNLRAAVEAHARESEGPLAVLACDVLPTARELADLRARFEASPGCALWFPLVRVPADASELGAFGWKPEYPVVRAPGAGPEWILPGHLGIFHPGALRLPLLYRLFDAAYRTRNRSVRYRRAVMLRMVVLSLLFQDLRLCFALRLPDRTATVVSSGLRLARQLNAGQIALAELETLIGRIFLRARVAGEAAVRFPIVDTLSLAEDIDTEEEARQLRIEVATAGEESAQGPAGRAPDAGPEEEAEGASGPG